MCCGKKRRALALGTLSAAESPSASADQTAEPRGISASDIDLLYLRQAPIHLRGMATGRLYQFSSSQRVQPVDRRDATLFLRTSSFFRPIK
jgi:hypothetical protein